MTGSGELADGDGGDCFVVGTLPAGICILDMVQSQFF